MLSAALCGAAFVGAVLSGALGLGGGTLLIAVLFAARLPPAEAVPLFAIVQMVANGTRSLSYLQAVDGRALLVFLAAGLPAAIVFAPLADRVPSYWAAIALGGLILLSLLPRRSRAPERGPRLPPSAAYAGAGLLNGTAGMFIGATGLIVGRMLVRPDWDRPRVVGTIAAAQMLGHLIKIVGFALAGTALLQRPALAAGMCLAAIAGTAIGTRFGDRLPEARFRAAFRIVLVVLAAQLLIDGIIQAWKPF